MPSLLVLLLVVVLLLPLVTATETLRLNSWSCDRPLLVSASMGYNWTLWMQKQNMFYKYTLSADTESLQHRLLSFHACPSVVARTPLGTCAQPPPRSALVCEQRLDVKPTSTVLEVPVGDLAKMSRRLQLSSANETLWAVMEAAKLMMEVEPLDGQEWKSGFRLKQSSSSSSSSSSERRRTEWAVPCHEQRRSAMTTGEKEEEEEEMRVLANVNQTETVLMISFRPSSLGCLQDFSRWNQTDNNNNNIDKGKEDKNTSGDHHNKENNNTTADPKAGGMSGWSVFLLVITVSFVSYMLVGFIYRTRVLGQKGMNALPHHKLWTRIYETLLTEFLGNAIKVFQLIMEPCFDVSMHFIMNKVKEEFRKMKAVVKFHFIQMPSVEESSDQLHVRVHDLSPSEQGALNQQKTLIRMENETYLRKHPEIQSILNYMIQHCLVDQPMDLENYLSMLMADPELEQRVQVHETRKREYLSHMQSVEK